jgi:hypothetical protein
VGLDQGARLVRQLAEAVDQFLLQAQQLFFASQLARRL